MREAHLNNLQISLFAILTMTIYIICALLTTLHYSVKGQDSKCANSTKLHNYNHCYLALDVVQLHPPTHYLREPGNITFTCLTTHGNYYIQSIEWILNGTFIEDQNEHDAQMQFSSSGNGLGTLSIANVPIHYNGTIVQCRARMGENTAMMSNNASILFRGWFALMIMITINNLV